MEESLYKIYQKVGNSLRGRRKQVFLLFLFIFGILVVYSYYYQIKVTSDLLYWTLSSIIQSLLALTALLTVGSIFKLQILYDYEARIADEVRRDNPDVVSRTGLVGEVLSLQEILEKIDQIIKKDPQNSSLRRLKRIKQIGEDILLSRDLTKDFALKFAIYNSFVVGATLLFLVFTPLIVKYYFGIPVLYLSGLLFIYSLFLVIKGITASLWQ